MTIDLYGIQLDSDHMVEKRGSIHATMGCNYLLICVYIIVTHDIFVKFVIFVQKYI